MNRTTALKILFVASALVTAPDLALARGPRLKNYKKLLLCVGALDDTQKERIQHADATALELEKQLRDAGVEVIAINEAEAAAAKAMRPAKDAADLGSDDSEEKGQPNAQALAMMNNPNMPAEAKAAMAQYMSPASKKGLAAQYAGVAKGIEKENEARDARREKSISEKLLQLCPHKDDIVVWEESGRPEFLTVMNDLGADGWVSVRPHFGHGRSNTTVGYLKGMNITTSSTAPVWVYETTVHNKKGKRVWQTGWGAPEIFSEKVKLPKDEAGQKKAIRESIPESVGQLVEKLTE